MELNRHVDQLRQWVEDCSATFADKYCLVTGEVARIESRDLDAMRLYDQAICFAREYGFVQNKGISNELAGGRSAGDRLGSPLS